MSDRKRYVFIDRDGTLIVEKDHMAAVEQLEILPGAVDGLQLLQDAGLGLILVTNQSVIGRGQLTPAGLAEIHDVLQSRLAAQGVKLDAIYYCPHVPDDGCGCRKPATGLAWRAAADWGFDPRRSIVVGDKPADIDFGRALGATTLLVRTGYGREYERAGLKADYVADDFLAAAAVIRTIIMETTPQGLLTPEAANRCRQHVFDSIETKQKTLDRCQGAILAAAEVIAGSLASGGKLMLCGNGGSAADARHIAEEFVSVLNQSFQRPSLAAVALTTDTSILTASANDFGFGGVFERQVQALGRPGDVLIGISTSGNSQNVLRAVGYARGHGIRTIALTSSPGGKLVGIADLSIAVPAACTQFVQEAHIMIGHIICDVVEQSIG